VRGGKIPNNLKVTREDIPKRRDIAIIAADQTRTWWKKRKDRKNS
jgi:hypothetical protein